MVKHAIVTRMTYRDKDKLRQRLPFTQQYLVESLRNQTVQRFEWVIVVMPGDEEFIRKELDYPCTPIPHPIRSPHGATPIHSYLVDGHYRIQTRVDSDDWLSPDCVSMLKKQSAKYATSFSRFLIHLQPVKYNHFTHRLYPMSTYRAPSVSSFLTLCQRVPDCHVLSYPHHQMHQLTHNIVMIGPGYARYVMHDSNDSLKKNRR